MTLWVLARYAGTKRLNEHLRTPRQSRVNRTWLILSRKICGGRLPQADSYFSSPFSHSFSFHNTMANRRDEWSCWQRGGESVYSLLWIFVAAFDKSGYGCVNGYEILMCMLNVHQFRGTGLFELVFGFKSVLYFVHGMFPDFNCVFSAVVYVWEHPLYYWLSDVSCCSILLKCNKNYCVVCILININNTYQHNVSDIFTSSRYVKL